jgi:hypothetical protein
MTYIVLGTNNLTYSQFSHKIKHINHLKIFIQITMKL